MRPIEDNSLKTILRGVTGQVFCLDQHPTEPWILCGLKNGYLSIWDYRQKKLLMHVKICNRPLRTAKFAEMLVLAGGEDKLIHVFNCITHEAYAFKAHDDWVRCIAVHPTRFKILSCGDNYIKLWKYKCGHTWDCLRIFIGHKASVNYIAFDPYDETEFASASSDTTIRVWQIGDPTAYLTSHVHTKGLHFVEYFCDGSHMISRDIDGLVQVWESQNRTCLKRKDVVPYYIAAADVLAQHPEIFIVLAGNIHDNDLFASVSKAIAAFTDHVQATSVLHGSNIFAIGSHVGIIAFKFNRNRPVISLGAKTGQIFAAKDKKLIKIKMRAADIKLRDGEIIPISMKVSTKFNIFPWMIAHDPKGRYFVTCDDDSYIVSTSIGLKCKKRGTATQFVWSNDSEFAILVDRNNLRVLASTSFFMQQYRSLEVKYDIKGIIGGPYLGVKSKGLICFYNWKTLQFIMSLHIDTQNVYWAGNYIMCLTAMDGFYIYFYHSSLMKFQKPNKLANSSLTLVYDGKTRNKNKERVTSGMWIGYCFLFITSGKRLNYCILGNEMVHIASLHRTMYILGYICSMKRLFIHDDDLNIVSYELPDEVIESQIKILSKDFKANKLLQPRVSPATPEHKCKIAKFIIKGNLQSTTANEIPAAGRFELAIMAGELELAKKLAEDLFGGKTRTGALWSRLGTVALFSSDLEIAKSCFQNTQNKATQLVFACSIDDRVLMEQIAREASQLKENNIAFYAYYMLKEMDKCLDLLVSRKLYPLAYSFARSHVPRRLEEISKLCSGIVCPSVEMFCPNCKQVMPCSNKK